MNVHELYELTLEFVESMARLESDQYWRSFSQGLQRSYAGEDRVSDTDHIMHMRSDEGDIVRGYRDGLTFGHSLRRGQEVFGDTTEPAGRSSTDPLRKVGGC